MTELRIFHIQESFLSCNGQIKMSMILVFMNLQQNYLLKDINSVFQVNIPIISLINMVLHIWNCRLKKTDKRMELNLTGLVQKKNLIN